MNHNIVFATDQNYIQHLGVALVSLLENNKTAKFTVFILHDGMSEENFNKLQGIADKYACDLKSIFIDDKIFNTLVTTHHFTKANYYRLLIPELLNDDIHQVLYLDADIVINGSLEELFTYDMQNYAIAAVEALNFNRHAALQMSSTSRYFCSGVMLLNLDQCRNEALDKKVIEFIETNNAVIEMVDQDGLNAVVDGHWLPLAPKYDQQTSFFSADRTSILQHFDENEFSESLKHPIIIHYTGTSKPWHYLNRHPYKYLYWKYLGMTPWKEFKHDDLNVMNVLRKIKYSIFKKAI